MNTLHSGDTFGELALQFNRPRAASIICKKETHFAFLEKEDYDEILKNYDTISLDNRIATIKVFPMFSGWTRNTLVYLSYFFNDKLFHRK